MIHFAGLKAVGESSQIPLTYYQNNITGTLVLCEKARAGVFRLVFSSSATVYRDPASVPLRKTSPPAPPTPYGRSKLMVEEILRDLSKSDPRWAIVLLRYFNPVGAHESGLIGEDPNGIPQQPAALYQPGWGGQAQGAGVFGNDYPTPDGTGVRDYIHVVGSAIGHLRRWPHRGRHRGLHL